MNEKKLRLGLVGKDVSKSNSERIHRFILNEFEVDCEYERFSIPSEELDNTMRRLLGDFDGFNVTIPYKRDIMEYLDEIVGDALRFGAVNTVVTATESGYAAGYNTDGEGFMQMLRAANIEVKDKKILILGGGGSGRSTAATLKKHGAQIYMYQRRRAELEETCTQLDITPADNPESGEYDILINCTGVGMHDTEGISPVSQKAFDGANVAIDLIYKPKESEFLRLARMCGLQTLNGAAMLFYQAYYADCLFLGKQHSSKQAEEFYQKYQEKYEI